MGVGGQHRTLAALPLVKAQYPLYRRLGGRYWKDLCKTAGSRSRLVNFLQLVNSLLPFRDGVDWRYIYIWNKLTEYDIMRSVYPHFHSEILYLQSERYMQESSEVIACHACSGFKRSMNCNGHCVLRCDSVSSGRHVVWCCAGVCAPTIRVDEWWL